MYDSGGDGWQGATYQIFNSTFEGDAGALTFKEDSLIVNGTMSDGFAEAHWFCLPDGCYNLTGDNCTGYVFDIIPCGVIYIESGTSGGGGVGTGSGTSGTNGTTGTTGTTGTGGTNTGETDPIDPPEDTNTDICGDDPFEIDLDDAFTVGIEIDEDFMEQDWED